MLLYPTRYTLNGSTMAAPMLLALSVSTLVTSAAFIAMRDAVTASRRDAEASGRLLADIARVLDVPVGQLGPCLGQSARTVTLWTVRGVPASHRDEVRQLARRASALRRRMPSARARHLLELQRRGADLLTDGMRHIREADAPPHATTMVPAVQSRLMRGVLITSR